MFVTRGTGYLGQHLLPRLFDRGHEVTALVRPGSEGKLPSGCSVVTGNALDRATFAHDIGPADTFLQLVRLLGVPDIRKAAPA